MIDIKYLRENPEAVKENIKKKFHDKKLPIALDPTFDEFSFQISDLVDFDRISFRLDLDYIRLIILGDPPTLIAF